MSTPWRRWSCVAGLAIYLSSTSGMAALDPRFHSMELPVGTRLSLAPDGPLGAQGYASTFSRMVHQEATLRSDFSPGCAAMYRTTPASWRVLVLSNRTVNGKDALGNLEDQLWTQVAVEEFPSCTGWVLMTNGRRFEDSPLSSWRDKIDRKNPMATTLPKVPVAAAAPNSPAPATQVAQAPAQPANGAGHKGGAVKPNAWLHGSQSSKDNLCRNGEQRSRVELLDTTAADDGTWMHVKMLEGPCAGKVGYVMRK